MQWSIQKCKSSFSSASSKVPHSRDFFGVRICGPRTSENFNYDRSGDYETNPYPNATVHMKFLTLNYIASNLIFF